MFKKQIGGHGMSMIRRRASASQSNRLTLLQYGTFNSMQC